MTAERFLTLPMGQWPETWDALGGLMTEAPRDLERELAQLAVMAARASAYLSRRMAGGKHQDAVRRQNQVAGRVRLALGFTYRDDPITF